MSITKSVDVFCDVCGQWVHGGICITIPEARCVAKRFGWTFRKNKNTGLMEDVCAECQRKDKEAICNIERDWK